MCRNSFHCAKQSPHNQHAQRSSTTSLSILRQMHYTHADVGQRRRTLAQAYTLKTPQGTEVSVEQVKYTVGSAPAADLQLSTANVIPEHAELQQKAKQVFLKALQGESVFDRTYTWIDDAEARPNVSYVLASGSTLAFGDKQNSYVIEFDEPSGANPLIEMMMKGVAASAGAEVQRELSQQ